MDPALLVVAAIYAVPLTVAAAAPAISRWRTRHKRRRFESWAIGAGFTQDENGVLRANLEEQRVELAFDSSSRLVLSVLIRPALDLGLLIQPAPWLPPAQGVAVVVDDPRFHSAFAAFGTEVFRVRELLDPALRQALLELVRNTGGLRLMDERLSIWLRDGGVDTVGLVNLLPQAAQLVQTVERRRPALPASRALAAFLPAWSDFASQHDLALSRAPLGLRGAFRGRDVWAVAVRQPDAPLAGPASHLLDVLCWFEPPLGVTIHITSRPSVDVSGVDQSLRITAFEDAFVVDALGERGAELLDDGLKRELERVNRERGAVTLTGEWFWVRHPTLPSDPAQAVSVMEDVAELAHVITQRARRLAPSGPGPYRARQ